MGRYVSGGGASFAGTPLGSSYATGTAAATIVSSGANVNGVRLCVVNLHAQGGSGDTVVNLVVDGDVILSAASDSGADVIGIATLTDLLIPPGLEVAITMDVTGTVIRSYYISYEVL